EHDQHGRAVGVDDAGPVVTHDDGAQNSALVRADGRGFVAVGEVDRRLELQRYRLVVDPEVYDLLRMELRGSGVARGLSTVDLGLLLHVARYARNHCQRHDLSLLVAFSGIDTI